MYNHLQYVHSLCSPYIEQTASGLPNPTPVEEEVRFFQVQDQPIVTTQVRVCNRVFSHSLDVVSKMYIHIIYSHFSSVQYQKRCLKLFTHFFFVVSSDVLNFHGHSQCPCMLPDSASSIMIQLLM